MGLPSQSLPTLLVKLLTHRCTIACDFSIHRQSAALSFSRLCNHRLLRSFRSRFSHNGGHIMLVPCPFRYREPTPAPSTCQSIHFCGTIRRLTPPGVSPDVCSWMHGLSSQFLPFPSPFGRG